MSYAAIRRSGAYCAIYRNSLYFTKKFVTTVGLRHYYYVKMWINDDEHKLMFEFHRDFVEGAISMYSPDMNASGKGLGCESLFVNFTWMGKLMELRTSLRRYEPKREVIEGKLYWVIQLP